MSQMTGNIQILEQGRPLSESLLFTLLTDYYRSRGPRAWDETPYYPTNNAFLADAYAEMTMAFWRDLDRAGQLDPAGPLEIVELASGAGALAVPLLAALEEKKRHFASLRALEVRYSLTDIVEANVEGWKTDPKLAALERSGAVRFCRFAPETDRALPFARPVNPPVVLANYYFDSIPHDYFQTDRGILRINRPALCRTLSADASPSDPPTLEELQIHDRFVEIRPESVYEEDSTMGVILREYAESLIEGSFFFPIGALRALTNLKSLLGERYCLLASDKGFYSPEFLEGHRPTPHTPHNGTTSIMVNFHALARWLEIAGGRVWSATENPALTTLAAATFEGDWENLGHAARTQLQGASPIQSVYKLADLLGSLSEDSAQGAAAGYGGALACVRLARFDAWVFQICAPKLLAGLPLTEPDARTALLTVLSRIDESLSPLSVGAFEAHCWLRCLYFHLGERTLCESVGARARAAFGPHRDDRFYAGALAEADGNFREARTAYREALDLDPDCAASAEGLRRVSGGLRGGVGGAPPALGQSEAQAFGILELGGGRKEAAL